MATELLSVPKSSLSDVIKVIREGLKHVKVSALVKNNLENWCRGEEDYLKRISEKEP